MQQYDAFVEPTSKTNGLDLQLPQNTFRMVRSHKKTDSVFPAKISLGRRTDTKRRRKTKQKQYERTEFGVTMA